MVGIQLLADVESPELAVAIDELAGYLRAAGMRVDGESASAVLVVADHPPSETQEDHLLALACHGVPVLLAGPTVAAWSGATRLLDAAGVLVGPSTPVHEIRVRPGPDAGEVIARTPDALVFTDSFPLLDKVADDVEVVLTANVANAVRPVATVRDGLATLTLGTHASTIRDPAYQRVVHRLLRRLLGQRDRDPLRVGMLGYGAIGPEHHAAIQAVEGLALAGVCDANPARLAAARMRAPDVTGYRDGTALLAADDIDLVVVSTPPNTHAQWVLRALEAGKSVVVEKPFCHTVVEADRQIVAAREQGLTLAVYQNRRWDADYLALARVVRSGAIGEVFHYESFVGGYGHPCNYWHSDEAVSGGAIYDWGSHYLDWLLDLLPGPIEQVSAATHKRVWHDVTNADHSRVTVRFADGAEGEFVHSDLAAAMKPKWYVLGTTGAIVGSWRQESVLARSGVGTLVEDPLAAAESPARLSLHRPDGSVTALAVPPPPAFPFHRELADQVLSGVPMSITLAGSRRTVGVLEAATQSARQGGRPVRLPQ